MASEINKLNEMNTSIKLAAEMTCSQPRIKETVTKHRHGQLRLVFPVKKHKLSGRGISDFDRVKTRQILSLTSAGWSGKESNIDAGVFITLPPRRVGGRWVGVRTRDKGDTVTQVPRDTVTQLPRLRDNNIYTHPIPVIKAFSSIQICWCSNTELCFSRDACIICQNIWFGLTMTCLALSSVKIFET